MERLNQIEGEFKNYHNELEVISQTIAQLEGVRDTLKEQK